MITRGNKGAASELLVAADLIGSGWEVFRAVSHNASCDLIAIAGDKVQRVEVRTTDRRKDGSPSVVVKETDRCDTYAWVIDGGVIYQAAEDARGDYKHANAAASWRHP